MSHNGSKYDFKNKLFAGYEKAMDILVSLLSSSGPEVWTGCEPALHSIMAHFAKEFRAEMVRYMLLDYDMSRVMRNRLVAYEKTKTQISSLFLLHG